MQEDGVRKSVIYRRYRYAIKFINAVHVVYALYFDRRQQDQAWICPTGRIIEDLGVYRNDFTRADRGFQEDDFAHARAYRVEIEDGDEVVDEGIVLSHESGLELFLIAAGAFVAMEAAKYSLKRLLEIVEGRINAWWSRRKHEPYLHADTTVDKLVDHIVIRSPHWEITVDGRFSSDERDHLIEQLAKTTSAYTTVEELGESVETPDLAAKIIAASVPVVCTSRQSSKEGV